MSQEPYHPRASLERKLQVVRDLTTAVARGFQKGLFLYGKGGLGKSFTIIRQLEALDVPHLLFNSRMTAKGLFQTLKRAPDVVHVLEDMERLTKDPDAQGVLRSAMWAQPGRERIVTWTTATDGSEQFIFRGGLILISNRPLADMPELVALATRIEVHRLEVSDAEVEALMRDIASTGHMRDSKVLIEPSECVEVTEYLLAECRRAGCPLDLRMQHKSFQTYLQWDSDHSVCHWKDLISASVREAAYHFQYEPDTSPREERRVRRRNVLREILRQEKDAREQERLYTERTGASRADFFRRKREIESGEFDPENSDRSI
jgi:hypothetical protein